MFKIATSAQGRAKARVLAPAVTAGACLDSCESVPVHRGKVPLEGSRAFGAVWLGWLLWRALKVDTLLERSMRVGRETVRWADSIAILGVARLCEPSSELHVAERWCRTPALEDPLGVPEEAIHDARLHRSLDRVLPRKAAIESHLVERFGELFDLDYDLLLHGVTSTYFEGKADTQLCKRGYPRDHRLDCVQANIALVVTREGMPSGYEIFPGNTADVSAVEEIVSTMWARLGKANRAWVTDRGTASEDNLEWLNHSRRSYVIGTPKAELKCWWRQIEDCADWRPIREDVEVKLCRGRDNARADVSRNDLSIRCVVRPDTDQALPIDRTGLGLPQRLRTPASIEMQCQPWTLSS